MKPKAELALSVLTYDGRPPQRALAARITGDTCVIGRHAACQLRLPDPEREISGQHVMIDRRGGGFVVTDVSTNGTFLNDAEAPLDPSHSVDLRDGDRLTIGRYVVQVTLVQAGAAPAQAAHGVESSFVPDAAPSRASCPDILDLIGSGPTAPADDPSPQREMPPLGAETQQLGAAPEGWITPGAGVAESAPPALDTGVAQVTGASVEQRRAGRLEDEPRPMVSQPSDQSSVPDPADVPTTLVALDVEFSRQAPETASDRGMARPHSASGSQAWSGAEERASAESRSANQGTTAADMPTLILPVQEAPRTQAEAPSGNRECQAPTQADVQAPLSDTAEAPSTAGNSRPVVRQEAPSLARSDGAPPARPRDSASHQSASPLAAPTASSGTAAEDPRANGDGGLSGKDVSVSADAPTQLLRIDAPGQALPGRDPEPQAPCSPPEPGQPLPGVLGGEPSMDSAIQPGLQDTAQGAAPPGASVAPAGAPASAAASGVEVQQKTCDAPSVRGLQGVPGGIADAAMPAEAGQGLTTSPASEPRADNPAPGAFDPGRTMEGPSGGAGLGQACVLDDATRIRAPMEAPPKKPLSASERAQVEAFLAGLGAGHADEIGDSGHLLRTSGKLLRTMTHGLATVTMAHDSFKNQLRPGMSPARSDGGNPFRFCLDLEDTLARVLWRPGQGHLDPSQAARQAFDDIEVHQEAMMAGFRAVLKALLARLEPHAIEQEVAGQAGLSQLLPNARKAKCWDDFMTAFEEIADDVSEDFAKVFGDAFNHAYDDHAERLREDKRRR